MPRNFFIIILTATLLLANCSKSTRTSTTAKLPTTEGLGKFGGGYKMVSDKESGFMKPVSTKGSQPFGKEANQHFGKNNPTLDKTFKKTNFDTQRWKNSKKEGKTSTWGKSEKAFKYSPKFIKDNARWSSTQSAEATQAFKKSSFKTKASRESKTTAFSKEADYLVKKRKNVFVQPQIISQQTYGKSGKSVTDLKEILKNE